MTLSEAKEILRTYKMPLTADQLARFRTALRIAAGAAFKPIAEV